MYRRKVSEMKNEAKWHIQSLQALFEDRVCLLREQKQGGKNDGAVLRAQRQMGSDVSEVKWNTYYLDLTWLLLALSNLC